MLFNACLFILGVLRTQEGSGFLCNGFFDFFGGEGVLAPVREAFSLGWGAWIPVCFDNRPLV